MKTCTVCFQTKPITAFYAHRGSGNQCKRCKRGQTRRDKENARQKEEARLDGGSQERPALSPELLALHRKESALDVAWEKAYKKEQYEKAAKIRARWQKVEEKKTRLMEAGNGN